MMIGQSWMRHTLPYMIVCWTVFSPIFCISVFILSAINYSELEYKRSNGRVYKYPEWAIAIGYTLAASLAVWIPLVGIYKFVKNGATMEVLKLLLVPYHLHPHQKRPQDQNERTLRDFEIEREGHAAVRSPSTLSGNLAFEPDKEMEFTQF